MSKMKELYEKIAADSALKAKFTEILKDAEKAGKEETDKKLVSFAEEEGYSVTAEEIVDFFKQLESKEGELSEEELDAVAGGVINSLERPPFPGISMVALYFCKIHGF